MMTRLKGYGPVAGAVCALGLGLGSAQAAPAKMPADVSALARELASAAVGTEGTASRPDRIVVRSVVEPALQSVIINGNAGPVKVASAIHYILAVCHPVDGKPHVMGDLTCPGAQGSYDALNNLSGVVQALLRDAIQPAAGLTGLGGPAYGKLTVTSSASGGPAYRSAT